MAELLIGSHVGLGGPDYYLGSVREALPMERILLCFIPALRKTLIGSLLMK